MGSINTKAGVFPVRMDAETDRRGFLAATAGAAAVGAGVGTATAQDENRVEIIEVEGEYIMDPVGLHIEPGETVVFESGSGAPHTSTAYEDRVPEGAEAWDSGFMDTGETFEHTFEVEGTYDYLCTPHVSLGQVGRIVVGEPGGPAEETEIPQRPAMMNAMPSGSEIVERGRISALDDDAPGFLGLPLTLAQGSMVSGFVLAAIVGTFLAARSDNNAKAAGIGALLAGVVMIVAVVIHLVT